jgi:cobaltochelatase CobN
MKPAAIDKELWDNIYDVYVKDEYKLNVKDFFEKQNPAALQEVTAVMMETARKGYWKASLEQLSNIAKLHTDLVRQFGPSSSGFTGDNAKLQQFIASQVDAQTAANYNKELKQMKQATLDGEATKGGMVLKKQSSDAVQGAQEEQNSLNGGLIAGIVLVAFVVMLLILKKKRKK